MSGKQLVKKKSDCNQICHRSFCVDITNCSKKLKLYSEKRVKNWKNNGILFLYAPFTLREKEEKFLPLYSVLGGHREKMLTLNSEQYHNCKHIYIYLTFHKKNKKESHSFKHQNTGCSLYIGNEWRKCQWHVLLLSITFYSETIHRRNRHYIRHTQCYKFNWNHTIDNLVCSKLGKSQLLVKTHYWEQIPSGVFVNLSDLNTTLSWYSNFWLLNWQISGKNIIGPPGRAPEWFRSGPVVAGS